MVHIIMIKVNRTSNFIYLFIFQTANIDALRLELADGQHQLQSQSRACQQHLTIQSSLSSERDQLLESLHQHQNESEKTTRTITSLISERDHLIESVNQKHIIQLQLSATVERHQSSHAALISERDHLIESLHQIQIEQNTVTGERNQLRESLRQSQLVQTQSSQATELHQKNFLILTSERDGLCESLRQSHLEQVQLSQATEQHQTTLSLITSERDQLMLECDRRVIETERMGDELDRLQVYRTWFKKYQKFKTLSPKSLKSNMHTVFLLIELLIGDNSNCFEIYIYMYYLYLCSLNPRIHLNVNVNLSLMSHLQTLSYNND